MSCTLIYVKQLPDVKRQRRWWYLLPLLMLVMLGFKGHSIHRTYTAGIDSVVNTNVVRNGVAVSWRTYCPYVISYGVEAGTERYEDIIQEQGYTVTESLRQEISTMLSGC